MKILLGLIVILVAYGEISLAATAKSRYGKVKSGQTIYSILNNLGFNKTQRNQALAASRLPKSFVIAPGDLYQIVNNPKSQKTEVHFFDPKKPEAFTFWKTGGKIGGSEKTSLNLTKKMATKSGQISGSLVAALTSATGDQQLAYRFMDAYILDFGDIARKIQRGAKFSLTYEKFYQDGVFIRNGEITKTELSLNGETHSRNFVNFSNGGAYVGGPTHRDRPLYAPVKYVRITSLFQPRRLHPIKNMRKPHTGIDFELPEGDPVLAAASGKVIRFGRNRGAGRFIVIKHDNGLESFYNHMSAIQPNIRKGLRVQAGTKIGAIGCSGYCTKPHLHFAVKKRGRFVNPIQFIRGYAATQQQALSKYLAQN